MSTPTPKPGLTPEALVGSVVGDRYRVDRLLDEGAMGRVYVGEHIHMRKRVALKILRPELTRVPEVMARFEREAMAAAHIAHPNVATATDFGRLEDGSVYLALEYVEGHNLRVEIKKGPIPVARALAIARQISEALVAAHALDIVHRDLKPENVMLVDRDDAEDFVKVLDFGVAKVPVDIASTRPLEPQQGALITKAGMVFGTPDYMAPEQALGQNVDGRADIYSLGVILYEMLAADRPFKTNHDFGILGQQLSGHVPPIASAAAGVRVPTAVEGLVRELLSNETAKRVQTAESLAQRLSGLEKEVRNGAFLEPAPLLYGTTVATGVDGVSQTEPAPPPSIPPPRFGRGSQSRLGLAMRIKARWSGLPDWEVLGVGAALLVVGVAGYALFHSYAASETTPSPPVAEPAPEAPLVVAQPDPEPVTTGVVAEKLTDVHVEDALQAGELAVEALLKRFPSDGRAHLAKARLDAAARRWSGAVDAARRALTLNPALSDDKHIASLLWKAVHQSVTQEAALGLLQGPMKTRGADVLYDLAVARGVRHDVAKQAAEWLDTRGFERVSTPETAAAAALFRAKSCKVRAALVKRAQNVGDRRSSALLTEFAAGKGCAPGEPKACNACLKGSEELTAAIATIEARHPEQN
jgi:serine/threonine-protein kinase